jgi:alpha-amylase
LFTGDGAVRSSEYTDIGRVTEFKYGAELGNAFRGNNPIKWLKNFGMLITYSLFPVSIKLVIKALTTDK